MLNALLIFVSLFTGLALFVGVAIRKHAREILANSNPGVAPAQPEREPETSTSLA